MALAHQSEMKGQHSSTIGDPDEQRILAAIEKLTAKVWYYHHIAQRAYIETRQERKPDNWAEQLAWAFAVESALADELGYLNELGWGVLNGKLIALRWSLGGEASVMSSAPLLALRERHEIHRWANQICDKVWYNGYYYNLTHEWSADRKRTNQAEYEHAMQIAQIIRQRAGADQLYSWSVYEWGVNLGILSALRWVLGKEWKVRRPDIDILLQFTNISLHLLPR